MKPCHICEKIVRLEKSVTCLTCAKGFCQMCINKYFPERANSFKKDAESAFPNIRVSQCFACLSECKCHKCKAIENVVLVTGGRASQPSSTLGCLVGEQVGESGFFRGRKVSELPLYLQRIYLKKKVLYSKHEISCLSNDKNIPEQQNNEQLQEKLNQADDKEERKEDETPLNQQDRALNQERLPGHHQKNGQENDNEDDEQQAQDYESEFPSRRAAHLHDHHEQSAINDADVEDQMEVQPEDPNVQVEAAERGESMADENAQSGRDRGSRVEEEVPPGQNNESSLEQAGE